MLLKNTPKLWSNKFPWKHKLRHKYSRGKVVIYGSKKDDNTSLNDLDNLWIVKKVSSTEINIMYYQDFNYSTDAYIKSCESP